MIKRTKEQRQNEVKIIIKKLTELHLNTSYDGIRILYQYMKDYIISHDLENLEYKETTDKENCFDKSKIIDIPCPELNIRIRGVLEVDLSKKVWVKLECLVKPEEEEIIFN